MLPIMMGIDQVSGALGTGRYRWWVEEKLVRRGDYTSEC